MLIFRDDADEHHKKENGKDYYKKKCGYKMLVYEEKEPQSDEDKDDSGLAKYIIDGAVDRFRNDLDDIEDAIEDALKALDIDFKFLSVWSSETAPLFSQDLKNPFCIVQNEQVFLYLEHCVWCYNEEDNCGPKNWGNHHPVSFDFFKSIS